MSRPQKKKDSVLDDYNMMMLQRLEHIDLDALLELANEAVGVPMRGTPVRADARVRIGLAHDDAFHFYYPDNLDLLREAGADRSRTGHVTCVRLTKHGRSSLTTKKRVWTVTVALGSVTVAWGSNWL